MRSLSIYGLIGAIYGLCAILVLTAIAVPAYHEYLMPLAMHRDIAALAPLANLVGTMSAWLPWVMFILFMWAWAIVAGRLNPSLARWPTAQHVQRSRAFASWIAGGLLLLAVFFIGFTVPIPEVFGIYKQVNMFSLILALIVVGAVWTLISPQAFGRFGPQDSRQGSMQRSIKLSWWSTGRTAGLGMLFALVFGLIMKAASAVFMTWFLVVTESLDRSMEQSMFGWVWLSIGMVVTLAIGFAIALGLLPAFVPGAGNWRARVRATCPALILLTGVLVVSAASVPLLNRIDVSEQKMLVNVVELSGIRPLSFRLVKFCSDKNCRKTKNHSTTQALKIGTPITRVAGVGMLRDGGYVPLHPNTVTALETFVSGKGSHSILRKAAMLGAGEVYKTLWQPSEAFKLINRFTSQGSMKHGSLLDTQIMLAWLMRASPINAETRVLLEELSDDKRYYIGNRASARLAVAWARFGDKKRAEELLARARRADPGKYDHINLATGGAINGHLSGQIVMPGVVSDGIRVGLFRLTEDPTKKITATAASKPPLSPTSVPTFNSTGIVVLTASVVLTTDGRFEFKDLDAGDYYIAVLLPDEKLKGKSELVGINIPDRIALNTTTPRHDIGVINLTAK